MPTLTVLETFTELPAGAEIEIYDAGFNDATVKVRCRNELYFVFRQDIGLSFGKE